jgi:hypothetical protein
MMLRQTGPYHVLGKYHVVAGCGFETHVTVQAIDDVLLSIGFSWHKYGIISVDQMLQELNMEPAHHILTLVAPYCDPCTLARACTCSTLEKSLLIDAVRVNFPQLLEVAAGACAVAAAAERQLCLKVCCTTSNDLRCYHR